MTDLLRRCLLLLVFVPLLAWTAEIDIVDPQLQASDDGYTLSADFRFDLNSRLEEAVNRGVVLYFVVDFELSRERWYWIGQQLLTASRTYRLSYHALTRQYRLSSGGLHQSFDTLGEAVRMLARLRGWPVIDKSERSVSPGETYDAALRLRLDITQLPRPFQISALGSKDWNLSADWKRWRLTLPEAK